MSEGPYDYLLAGLDLPLIDRTPLRFEDEFAPEPLPAPPSRSEALDAYRAGLNGEAGPTWGDRALGILETVTAPLGLMKRGVDALARAGARAQALEVPAEATTGSLVREAAGLSTDPAAGQGEQSISERLGGKALEFGTDILTDPLTTILGGAGRVAAAGRTAGAALEAGGLVPEAAAAAAAAAASGRRAAMVGRGAAAAFAPGMAVGAAHDALGAYRAARDQSWGDFAEASLGTVLSGGMAALTLKHALSAEPAAYTRQPALDVEPQPGPWRLSGEDPRIHREPGFGAAHPGLGVIDEAPFRVEDVDFDLTPERVTPFGGKVGEGAAYRPPPPELDLQLAGIDSLLAQGLPSERMASIRAAAAEAEAQRAVGLEGAERATRDAAAADEAAGQARAAGLIVPEEYGGARPAPRAPQPLPVIDQLIEERLAKLRGEPAQAAETKPVADVENRGTLEPSAEVAAALRELEDFKPEPEREIAPEAPAEGPAPAPDVRAEPPIPWAVTPEMVKKEAGSGGAVVMVPTADLLRIAKEDIERPGRARQKVGDTDKLTRAKHFFAEAEATGEPIHTPEISVSEAGKLVIDDGYHRAQAAADAGAGKIPVRIPRGNLAKLRELGLPYEDLLTGAKHEPSREARGAGREVSGAEPRPAGAGDAAVEGLPREGVGGGEGRVRGGPAEEPRPGAVAGREPAPDAKAVEADVARPEPAPVVEEPPKPVAAAPKAEAPAAVVEETAPAEKSVAASLPEVKQEGATAAAGTVEAEPSTPVKKTVIRSIDEARSMRSAANVTAKELAQRLAAVRPSRDPKTRADKAAALVKTAEDELARLDGFTSTKYAKALEGAKEVVRAQLSQARAIVTKARRALGEIPVAKKPVDALEKATAKPAAERTAEERRLAGETAAAKDPVDRLLVEAAPRLFREGKPAATDEAGMLDGVDGSGKDIAKAIAEDAENPTYLKAREATEAALKEHGISPEAAVGEETPAPEPVAASRPAPTGKPAGFEKTAAGEQGLLMPPNKTGGATKTEGREGEGPLFKQEQAAAERKEAASQAKFSVKEKEEGGDLSAFHNITAEEFLKADKIGGLPMPSIAITRGKVHEGYGGITLVGDRRMVDPKESSANMAYPSDAYTARFPETEWKLKRGDVKQKFIDQFPRRKEFGEIGSDLWDELDKGPDAAFQAARKSNYLRAAFLAEKGIVAEPVIEKVRPYNAEIAKDKDLVAWRKANPDAQNYRPGTPEWEKFSTLVKGAIDNATFEKDNRRNPRQAMRERILDGQDGQVHFGPGDRIIDDLDVVIGKKTQLNKNATSDQIDTAMKPHEAEYEAWMRKRIAPLYEGEFLRLGRKRVPVTLDNLVESMRRAGAQGAEKTMVFGSGNARAVSARPFPSVEAMREAKHKIVSAKDFKEWKDANEKLQTQMQESLWDSYRVESSDYSGGRYVKAWVKPEGFGSVWDGNNAMYEAMAKFLKGGPLTGFVDRSPARARAMLRSSGFLDPPPLAVDLFRNVAESIMDAPTEYFEAKPRRAVQLEEFKGAAIPEDTPAEVREALTRRGIPFETYKGKDSPAGNVDRQRAVDKLLSDAEQKGSEARFKAVEPGARGEVTADLIRRRFGSIAESVKEEGDGFRVKFDDGLGDLVINPKKGIEYRPGDVLAGRPEGLHGREIIGKAQKLGADVILDLLEGRADMGTLGHEELHGLLMAGRLRAKEIDALFKEHGTEEAIADHIGGLVKERLEAEAAGRVPAQPSWFGRLWSYLKRLGAAFRGYRDDSAVSAGERIASGEVYRPAGAVERGVASLGEAIRGDGTRERPVSGTTPEAVETAAGRVEEPSPAQAAAGNYQKGHVAWNGLDISIETPKGGTRTAKDGSWKVEDFPAHYGYLKRTEGRDGEHVDVFMGENPASDKVFVIDQGELGTGRFDEHKVLLGFDSEADARATYVKAFTDGKGEQRIRAMKAMSVDDFKTWLEKDDTTKPIEKYSAVVKPMPTRAAVPPLATGRTMEPGEAPRVEKKVEKLREIEGRAGFREAPLDRDEIRSHPEVEAEANRLLRTEDEKTLMSRAQKGKLSDAEVMAVDALRQRSVETFEAAAKALKDARTEDSGVSEANANFIEAAFDHAAKEAAARVRTDVNAGTALGRALAARARVMSAGRSMPDAFLRKIFREIEGISDDQAANLVKLLHEAPELLPDAIQRAIRPGKLSKFLELWKAGLISAPGTQLANIFGNVGEFAARAGETLTAAAVDRLIGGDRTRLGGEVKAEVVGGISVLRPAMGKLRAELSDIFHLRPEALDLKAPLERQVGAIEGKKGRLVRIPFRLLQAFDDFFKNTGGAAELGKLAYRKAGLELKGAGEGRILERAAEIQKEALDPDNADHGELLAKVAEARQTRTFQGTPGELIQGLINLRTRNPFLHFVAPFLQTPGAIAKLTIERSPYGFFKAKKAYDAFRFAEDSGAAPDVVSRLRGEAVDAIARPLMGTMLLSGFAAYAATGGMTGSGPADPRERNLLRETGWQPYSFVGIDPRDGKKFYVPFNRFEPVSSMLGIAADMAELKDEKKTGDLFNKALGSIASNITSKTYLQGLSDAAAMISKPDQFASQYVSSLAGSAVPNIIGKTAQAIDPTLRDVAPSSGGIAGIPERIGKTIASRIPGVSTLLPARKSGTGKPIERPGEGVLGALSRFALPVQITKERPGKELEHVLIDIDAIHQPPSRTLTIPGSKGRKVELTTAELGILQEADKKATEQLRKDIAKSEFQGLDDIDKKRYVERVYERYRYNARKMLYQQPGFESRAARIVRAASQASV